MAKIKTAASIDEVRGHEGMAARIYFDNFRKLVAPFVFKNRVYHPPDGPAKDSSSGMAMVRGRHLQFADAVLTFL